MSTPITNIPGIGPATAKALATNGFTSAEDIASAKVNALCAVQGFGPVRAQATIAAAAQVAGAKLDKLHAKKAPKKRKNKSQAKDQAKRKSGKKKKDAKPAKSGKKAKRKKSEKKKSDKKSKDEKKSGKKTKRSGRTQKEVVLISEFDRFANAPASALRGAP